MIRVAIVEDDDELRKFMEDTINSCDEFFMEGSFSSAEDFKREFYHLSDLNVVVMDINLPGMSGIQCIEELKPKNSKIQYLVCTVFEDSMNLFNALCAGATGYILKSAAEEEIVNALKEINSGGSPMSPQIARMVVTSFPRKQTNVDLLNQLTKREKELLDLLAAGYQYKEIADKLFLSIQTVRSYIRDIYSKLHVHRRTDAVNKVFNR
ncbi:MAG TPA: response regulator transcription factor [Bacteroidia bacterium]|nr:response regulator transcription factor [Bacteroidia bacterium]